MLLVTPRTRPETLAKAASHGIPLPLQLAKTLSGSDLLRILRQHANAEYGDELAEILLASPAANARLVETALKRFPTSPGVKNAAALSAGASRKQLLKLARSRLNSARQHARLSLLSDSLSGAPEQQFLKAVKRAEDSADPAAELYIIVVHPDTPKSVLQVLANLGPDFIRDEASRRLSKRRRAR